MAGKSKLSLESKMQIVILGFAGKESIAEICRRYGISQAYYQKLKAGFLKGAKKGLNGKGESSEIKQLKNELSVTKEVIAELTVHNRILKKTLNL